MNATTTKETKVATQEKLDVNTLDLSKLPLEALKRLLDNANESYSTRKVDELAKLVEGWWGKAKLSGYTLEEVQAEFQKFGPAPAEKKQRAKRGTATPKEAKARPVPGTTYAHGENKWVAPASGKGAAAKWLRDAIAAGGKYEDYAMPATTPPAA